MEDLAAAGFLPNAAITAIVDLIEDFTLPAHARSRLIASLSHAGQIVKKLGIDQLLSRYAAMNENDEIRFSSIEVLVRTGLWQDYDSSINRSLDLVERDGVFRWGGRVVIRRGRHTCLVC